MTHNSENTTPTAYSAAQATKYDVLRFTDPAGHQIHLEEVDRLLKATSRLPVGSAILEVGCGTGRLLEHLKDGGFHLSGVDAARAMLDQLRQKPFSSNIEMIESDAHSLPFESGRFDFTYCIRLLNQTANPLYALSCIEEMHRVTRPGGLVLVEYMSADRPSIRGRRGSTTTLEKEQVAELAALLGSTVISFDGAFLLGMTARHVVPSRLLPAIPAVERFAPRWSQKYASRCYFLLRVATNNV